VEDWELWARLAFHAPILCRRRPLVRYRRHRSNTPLATMRLRYPCVIEALLRNLPLSGTVREEVCARAAERLVEYAAELLLMRQPEASRHCLEAAAGFHPAIVAGEHYGQIRQRL
jgi:hypothetical protein